jgi:SAM-dependent methyltransferase
MGRRFLTRFAYADDRCLQARMAIYAYAESPPDPRWRTSAVPWDGTQLVADVGCGNGFDLRRLVPEGRCRYAFGLDLSAGMLRSLDDLRSSGRLSLVQADTEHLPLCDSAVDVAMAMHVLHHVPNIPAAVRELRRIVRRDGMVLASTNSDVTLAEVHHLLDAAVSELLGRPVEALPPLPFTTENGAAILQTEFSEVTLRHREVPLKFPEVRPLITYLDSLREPILSHIGQPLDFDAVLDIVATGVERVIREQGNFRTVTKNGVFVCRSAR